MPPNNHSHPHLHPWARWNLIFAYVSLFYYGLCDNIRGPLYPEMTRHFALTNMAGTWFFALSSLLSIAGGLGASLLLSRWGYLRMFRLSLVCLAGAQFFYAASPSFSVFVLGSVLLGIAMGLLGVIQNILVLTAASPAYLPRWMNGLHANYAAASLFSPLVASTCFLLSSDFQLSFWGTAAVGTVLLISSWWIPGFVEPAQVRGLSQSRRHAWDGQVVYFGGILSCYVVAEIMVATRLAQFVRETLNGTAQEGRSWTALFFVGLLAGRLLFTFLPDGGSIRRRVVAALGASTLFLMLAIRASPWWFLPVGLAMGPCYALIMSLLRSYFPHRLEVATSACIMISGVFVVAMHLGAGALTDAYGVQWVLGLTPLFCFVAFLLLWAYPRVWPNSPEGVGRG